MLCKDIILYEIHKINETRVKIVIFAAFNSEKTLLIMKSNIDIANKKAEYLYELHETFTAGIQLVGSEIKSIRQGKVSFSDAYCFFKDEELWVKIHISGYKQASLNDHEPKRDRKLLLTRRELNKLITKVQVKGFTIIPVRLFIEENGFAKLDIALAKGKRKYDKRQSMKKQDDKREMDRMMKY